MIECIKSVLDGKRYIGQEFQELILTEAFVDSKIPKKRHKNILSAREYEIAMYLSDGHKTSWIAQKLQIKPTTISTIKRNIFTKLRVDNIVDLRNFVSKV